MNRQALRDSMDNSGGGDGDLFVKLADKERTLLVPMGDLFVRKKHWAGNSSEECTAPNCQYCDKGDKVKTSWLTNVFDAETKTMKVWELSYYTAEDFYDESEDAPEWMVYSVKRLGTEKKTKYKVRADAELPVDLQRVANALELHGLEQFGGKPMRPLQQQTRDERPDPDPHRDADRYRDREPGDDGGGYSPDYDGY